MSMVVFSRGPARRVTRHPWFFQPGQFQDCLVGEDHTEDGGDGRQAAEDVAGAASVTASMGQAQGPAPTDFSIFFVMVTLA